MAVDRHADPAFVRSQLLDIVADAVTGAERLLLVSGSDAGVVDVFDRDFAATITAENATTDARRRHAARNQLTQGIDCLVDRLRLGSDGNPWPAVRSAAERLSELSGERQLVLLGPWAPAGREWSVTNGGDIETPTARAQVTAMVTFDGGMGPVADMDLRVIGAGDGAGDSRYREALRLVIEQIAGESGATAPISWN